MFVLDRVGHTLIFMQYGQYHAPDHAFIPTLLSHAFFTCNAVTKETFQMCSTS